MVDWDTAREVGIRLAPGGPKVTPGEAGEVVAHLRHLAVEARGYVADVTGLVVPDDSAPVAVIDRSEWVRANVAGFRLIIDPLADRIRARHQALKSNDGDAVGAITAPDAVVAEADAQSNQPAPSEKMGAVGPKVTGTQVGGILAFLSGKVLGQFELLVDGGEQPRLLLVAPNIVAAERAMEADPRDFRLWVAAHEETHRVQFAATPWLSNYLLAQVREFVEETDIDPGALAKRVRAAFDAASSAVRSSSDSSRDGSRTGSLLDAVQTPAQREILSRTTAVMSLLEGHADYVMDAVGPAAIPSVDAIRAKFDERRKSARGLDALLRRLLGFDAKMAQYRDGAAFVRAVVDEVGMARFNTIWTSPETLPTTDEIHDPSAWVARIAP